MEKTTEKQCQTGRKTRIFIRCVIVLSCLYILADPIDLYFQEGVLGLVGYKSYLYSAQDLFFALCAVVGLSNLARYPLLGWGLTNIAEVRGDGIGNTLFEFLADNITGSPSSVEIGQIMTGIEGDKGLHFITTSHTKQREAGLMNLIKGQVGRGYTIREINHSHPTNNYPSGLNGPNKRGEGGDMEVIRLLTNSMSRIISYISCAN